VSPRYLDSAKITESDAKFTAAFGRFVMTWADTEAELYRVLRHYAGVDDAIARAIFSGTRADAMMKFILAILHNTKPDPARVADLKFLFPQIAAINTIRDRLVHYAQANASLWLDEQTRTISNIDRVSRYGNHYIEDISAQTLADMTYDFNGICNHLNVHWSSKDRAFSVWEENSGEVTKWLYKSPPSSSTEGASVRDTPKRKRSQRPSRPK
jgi:hypothetical protein